MNCQMKPFTDVRVRRAINYGIDRNKLVALLNGRGVVATGVLPPSLPGYDPKLPGYSFDPKTARALLRQAGLAKGFSFELWMRADTTMLMMGQSIQQDLALIGVHAEIKPVAWAPFLDAIRQPNTAQSFVSAGKRAFPIRRIFLAFSSRAVSGDPTTTASITIRVSKIDRSGRGRNRFQNSVPAIRTGGRSRSRTRRGRFWCTRSHM